MTWAYQEQFLRIYTVFNRAVKMSDFSLSLEDIDLLINGKIPLIISQNRPSHAAYQVLYNFILAIHRGNPKQTPCSLVTFSRRFTLFPFQKIKKLALLEVQIYISTNKECKLIE